MREGEGLPRALALKGALKEGLCEGERVAAGEGESEPLALCEGAALKELQGLLEALG